MTRSPHRHVVWGLAALAALAAPAAAAELDLPRFPAISPDGEELVVSWRGDLWRVAAGGAHMSAAAYADASAGAQKRSDAGDGPYRTTGLAAAPATQFTCSPLAPAASRTCGRSGG